MSKRIKKNAHTLQYLSKCDKHTATSILKSSNPELVNCISDICHNILKDKVKLTPREKTKLSKYKLNIRKLANPKATQKTKRVLIQKGGFLPILLQTIAPLVAPLAKKLLGIP